jgi:hypothetical protein
LHQIRSSQNFNKKLTLTEANMAFNKALSAAAFVAASFAFLGATTAHAQLYKWTDENGKVHYSDTVPPTATDRARKELRSDAQVKKEVERAPTPEERRVAAQKAAAEAAERAVKEERERKDKALLATYSSLADFDRVRDRAVSLADAELTALKRQEELDSARRADLQKQVDAAKKGPPPKLKTDFDSVEKDLAAVRALIERKTKDRSTLVASFTSERSRFSELLNAEKAAAASGNAPTSAATVPAKKKL